MSDPRLPARRRPQPRPHEAPPGARHSRRRRVPDRAPARGQRRDQRRRRLRRGVAAGKRGRRGRRRAVSRRRRIHPPRFHRHAPLLVAHAGGHGAPGRRVPLRFRPRLLGPDRPRRAPGGRRFGCGRRTRGPAPVPGPGGPAGGILRRRRRRLGRHGLQRRRRTGGRSAAPCPSGQSRGRRRRGPGRVAGRQDRSHLPAGTSSGGCIGVRRRAGCCR